MASISRPLASATDLGGYDALVCGGGLSGWAAAVSLARAGHRTLLASEHTSLGHEVWGAMSVWWPPDASLPVPALWREVAGRLAAANAARGPLVDPVATQVLLEQMAREAGVRVLLQVTAHGGKEGPTLLTGKWGLMAARAVVVIDATARGRLALERGASLRATGTDEPVVRRALMVRTGVAEPRRMEVGRGLPLRDSAVMVWPALWPGEVVVEAEFALPIDDTSVLEIGTRRAMAEVAARLRAADEAFGRGSLMHIAHEPILPRERVLVARDDASAATQVECDEGVFDVARGALLPAGADGVVAASPAVDLGPISARACSHAPNAVRLGEAAAQVAQALVEGGAS
ncbi:MAG: FAD-dependent oxidoreductase [Armatimonadota bacterium]